MPGMMEGLSTINSFLRTLIALVVMGGIGAGSYYGYTTYNAKEIDARQKAKALEEKERALADWTGRLEKTQSELNSKVAELEAKNKEIAALNASVKKLEMALRYLKIDHRVARFTSVDQTKDDATGEVSSLIEFVELN